ncbi:MFS transporter [Comamonas sp. B-9]|uniref:MFS transporter n=1 Tax=Comamonas sp. B-9 TaxID=1055192 RepID=UPI000A040521|nr:MFS transporter [Comamonas sp. B-9]
MALNRKQVTIMLGVAQTLSWASSYYLIAVLAMPIGHSVDATYSEVFGAFSAALLVAAAVGPLAGRFIDRLGGRLVLIVSNLIFALGLLLLSQATQTVHVFVAWAVIGLAMGSGLYEAAFSTVVHLYGQNARPTITGIALIAGFASTVGWPLSSYLQGLYDWRVVCMFWAALHLLIGIPLNVLLSHAKPNAEAVPEIQESTNFVSLNEEHRSINTRRTAFLMAYVFAVTWFVSTAMAAHLPLVLQTSGTALAASIAAAAMVGPGQVAGRVLEYGLLRNAHPLLSARLAILAHPLATISLVFFGNSAASAFAILHGLGNGILTIAIGTLPLKVFGARGYGQRQGWLMVPARIVQAGSPFLFGLAVANWGSKALWLTSLLAISAFAALCSMRVSSQQ